ncbi:MAG: hypothetical protein ACP5QO_05085 [Clostridia bacterium]
MAETSDMLQVGPLSEQASDAMVRQAVWGRLELLQITGSPPVDLVPQAEHHMMVLSGAGTARLGEADLTLTPGTVLGWARDLPFSVRAEGGALTLLYERVPFPPSAMPVQTARETPVEVPPAPLIGKPDPSVTSDPAEPPRQTGRDAAPVTASATTEPLRPKAPVPATGAAGRGAAVRTPAPTPAPLPAGPLRWSLPASTSGDQIHHDEPSAE